MTDLEKGQARLTLTQYIPRIFYFNRVLRRRVIIYDAHTRHTFLPFRHTATPTTVGFPATALGEQFQAFPRFKAAVAEWSTRENFDILTSTLGRHSTSWFAGSGVYLPFWGNPQAQARLWRSYRPGWRPCGLCWAHALATAVSISIHQFITRQHAWVEGKKEACNVPSSRGQRTGTGQNVRRHSLHGLIRV